MQHEKKKKKEGGRDNNHTDAAFHSTRCHAWMARRQEAHQLRLSVYARYELIRNALLALLASSPLLYSLYIYIFI